MNRQEADSDVGEPTPESSLMPAITFSGLSTGLDTAGIISQLMQLERMPVDRLETKKKNYDSQASKFRSLETKLKSLQDAAKKLGKPEDVLTTKVSTSDEKVFTATSSGGAAVGPTDIHVTSLAKVEKTYSNTFADKTATGAFGTGTLTLQVGSGDPVDITVDGTDTLESVVGKINGSGADVTAGLMFDGTNYRLRVTGNDTGAANAISFTETGTSLGLDVPANQVQAAVDAVFSVDGFAMTRASNTFSDAVPGVSITLTGASPDATPATLGVQRDTDALREKAQGFVDAYNEVAKGINAEFAYTGKAKGAGSLVGDSALRSVQSRLRSFMGSAVPGTSGAYRTLASIGIQTNQDGTLKLDAADFDEAVGADANAVSTLLAGNRIGGIDGFVKGFDDLIDEFVDSADGIIPSRIDALEGRNRDIDKQIDRLELRLEKTEEQLVKQYAKLEELVSGLTNQGNQIMAALVGLG
ncbi:MAG: hypothetical protein EVA89_11105 [Sandaracinaceae bacterium]|nr:MAG: hypothetical protein EVA89_11105 [Sandaracinaceae bacterium]HBQ14986.1 hypothetical protein [Myxococcales bacterium]